MYSSLKRPDTGGYRDLHPISLCIQMWDIKRDHEYCGQLQTMGYTTLQPLVGSQYADGAYVYRLLMIQGFKTNTGRTKDVCSVQYLSFIVSDLDLLSKEEFRAIRCINNGQNSTHFRNKNRLTSQETGRPDGNQYVQGPGFFP